MIIKKIVPLGYILKSLIPLKAAVSIYSYVISSEQKCCSQEMSTDMIFPGLYRGGSGQKSLTVNSQMSLNMYF